MNCEVSSVAEEFKLSGMWCWVIWWFLTLQEIVVP